MIRHAGAACLLSLLILALTAIVVSRSGPIDADPVAVVSDEGPVPGTTTDPIEIPALSPP